jgi:hypothetical protein
MSIYYQTNNQSTPTVTIPYCSARPGSGKTHERIREVVKMARDDQKIVVPQTTKELIARTIHGELRRYQPTPLYTVLHGDTVSDGSVADAISEHTKQDAGVGQVLFTSHQVLPFVKHWSNQQDWHLRADEEFQVLRHRIHQLPDMHHIITDYIEIIGDESGYGRVLVRGEKLREQARNRNNDEVLAILAETSRLLVNPNWECFICLEQYERLRAGAVQTLEFHCIVRPDVVRGFGSVCIDGANFEDSTHYQLWKRMGVNFVRDKAFTQSLRYQHHTNGDLINIHYATEDGWSRKLRTTEDNLDRVIEGAKKVLGDEPFVWQANKGVSDDILGENARSSRLPHRPHGLNTYAGINNILFLSSLNPSPQHFHFLKSRGMSGDDVHRATYYSVVYQAATRISTRDPQNTEPKNVVVPDLGVALFLQRQFPGSQVRRMDTSLRTPCYARPRPSCSSRRAKKVETPEERRRRQDRERKERRRRVRGAKPRAKSLSTTRPWEVEGVSRRTWYRRHQS